jgi:hypothetical protein
MPIRIPSGKIFDTQNPKIRDNYIDRLEVECKTVSPSNEYDVRVFQSTVNSNMFVYNPAVEDFDAGEYTTNAGLTTKTESYVSISLIYLKGYRIEINAKVANAYINRVKDKTNADGEPNIKCAVYYTRNIYKIDTNGETLQSSVSGIGSIPDDFVVGESSALYSSAKVELSNDSNAKTLEVIYDKSTDKFYIYDLRVLAGGVKTQYSKRIRNYETPSVVYTDDSQKIEYIPTQIEITLYGETVGINLKDESIVFGDANGENPYSISGNELVQTNGTFVDNFGYLVDEYSNGKESATLLCAVGEYYDFDTNALVISTKRNGMPMVFNHYDEVIPMVYGTDGRDRPMSRYPNGGAKVFKVLGVEMMYNGAVWQKLYLQEV